MKIGSETGDDRIGDINLFDAPINVNIELLAKVVTHAIAEALSARGVLRVGQGDERDPDRGAALAVGVGDPVGSRILRQGHELVGALAGHELRFQVLLASAVRLNSHIIFGSATVGLIEWGS